MKAKVLVDFQICTNVPLIYSYTSSKSSGKILNSENFATISQVTCMLKCFLIKLVEQCRI